VTSDLFLTSLDSDIRMTPSPLDKSEDGWSEKMSATKIKACQKL
jgi:hypothetical protein